jgi:pimeloyl-ACP methyl ester carboxylesterase
MPALAKHHQVVAIDQRGYNKSDQPQGVENYTIDKLVSDVDAVMKQVKKELKEKTIIVGHDWGGLVAWTFAMTHPDETDGLIILNLPHPKGMLRELAHNPQQQKNSQYARDFQKPDAASKLKPELLAFWIKEPEARKQYIEAFRRSSIEGMLNYYKANYPKEPYQDDREFPPVKCTVLMIHGLRDPYLLPGALNDTWKWVEKDFTLVTIPRAGHFVHRDASKQVTETMVRWLDRFAEVVPSTAATEDKPLSPIEARKKVGEKVTVEMTVQATKDRLEKRGEIYLDAESNFRDEKNFAVIITKIGAQSLKESGIDNPAEYYKQKKIRATGTVKEVDNVPRIEIANAKQIALVDSR